MKIYIDLRPSLDSDFHNVTFAWYCSVTDTFETHSDTQTFESWEDFEGSYEGQDIERYHRLLPPGTDIGRDLIISTYLVVQEVKYEGHGILSVTQSLEAATSRARKELRDIVKLWGSYPSDVKISIEVWQDSSHIKTITDFSDLPPRIDSRGTREDIRPDASPFIIDDPDKD